ncbi:MAG TPA: metal-sensitive transcriptional regulator [Actinomycetota bacterium]|nr:metal-sensitive transcriptional regulator [Actinomycetota bacterium]
MAARPASTPAPVADASIRTHHGEIVRRLQRIEGQVSGIGRRFHADRYCIDVLDQISAARAGLEGAALLILDDHVNGCVTEAIEGGRGREKTEELLDAVRRHVRSV